MQISEICQFAQRESRTIAGRVCRICLPVRSDAAEQLCRREAVAAILHRIRLLQQDTPAENGRNVKKIGMDCEN